MGKSKKNRSEGEVASLKTEVKGEKKSSTMHIYSRDEWGKNLEINCCNGMLNRGTTMRKANMLLLSIKRPSLRYHTVTRADILNEEPNDKKKAKKVRSGELKVVALISEYHHPGSAFPLPSRSV
jgi:hypothetical protein